MRRKPYARPELEASFINIQRPLENYGRWHSVFPKKQPVFMELGCGKGGFIAELAAKTPEKNFLAIDIKSEVLVLAKRNIERAFKGKKEEEFNVRIMSQDIERIDLAFSPSDKIERIYINFPNPWPKDRHKKRRLTHSRQLMKYREFLEDNGEIYFKTDSSELFEESLDYFKESGFEITFKTLDLHKDGLEGNITTEHEDMFTSIGIPIKMLIAKKV